MREMLETFRLPGEAQQISRITENFAEIYFAAEPGESYCYVCLTIFRAQSQADEIKSQDAVYVLAFSIIMLNTDQHSPQIRVSSQTLVSQDRWLNF